MLSIQYHGIHGIHGQDIHGGRDPRTFRAAHREAQSFPLLRYWYRRAVRFDQRSGLLTAGLPLTVTELSRWTIHGSRDPVVGSGDLCDGILRQQNPVVDS